jgi:hypothetical protein
LIRRSLGGRGQRAPLTPEYQAIHDASLADQAAGGLGGDLDHARCGAEGMPFMMVAFRPLEFVITPQMTYIIVADYDPLRRIFHRWARLGHKLRANVSGLF